MPPPGRIAAVVLALGLAGCNAGQERAGAQGSVGYTVTAPEGWEDVTRELEERTETRFDVAYSGRVEDGVRTNVNIVRRDAPPGARIEKLVREGQDEVRELSPGPLEFTDAVVTEVDGAAARRYDFTRKGARVRQVAALYEGDYYVVTLTAASPAFSRAVARLDGLLRSWRWD